MLAVGYWQSLSKIKIFFLLLGERSLSSLQLIMLFQFACFIGIHKNQPENAQTFAETGGNGNHHILEEESVCMYVYSSWLPSEDESNPGSTSLLSTSSGHP